MANTLLTPKVVAREVLALLRANMVAINLVNKDYSDEFKKVGNTVDVRNLSKLEAKRFNGEIVVQDLNETPVAVKLDRHLDVSVAVTSVEKTLDVVDFVKQIAGPSLLPIANQIDKDILAYLYEIAGATVTATNSTDLSDIANLAKRLDIELAPIQERHVVMPPEHKYKYATKDNLSKVSYAGDNVTLREASLGKIYSLETWMDQNMPKSSAATTGTATSYKVASGTTNGKVNISALSAATATVKIGDGFIYKGEVYKFTEDGTGVSSAIADIAVTPAFPTGVSASDVVLLPVAGSVAFHKDAVTFVSRPLEIPNGASNAAYESDGEIAVRVVFDYDIKTKKDIVSFDVLYGLATLRKDFAVRLSGI